jgi:hypothetical protein
MTLQIDSREKARAIKSIVEEFNRQNIKHFVSKLPVGDYMNYDNPRIVVDRKQNLTELCSNVCQDHERFRNEMVRANDIDVHIIFLIEHGHDINCKEDVIWWVNPRSEKRVQDRTTGKWKIVQTNAMSGETLYKIMCTMEQKYGVEFIFCDKEDTGRRIIEILGGEAS